jgi:hypothetical protein
MRLVAVLGEDAHQQALRNSISVFLLVVSKRHATISDAKSRKNKDAIARVQTEQNGVQVKRHLAVVVVDGSKRTHQVQRELEPYSAAAAAI